MRRRLTYRTKRRQHLRVGTTSPVQSGWVKERSLTDFLELLPGVSSTMIAKISSKWLAPAPQN